MFCRLRQCRQILPKLILLPYLLFFFYVHNVSFFRLPCPPLAKRGSLTHSQALALSKRARDVTALRCSEPLLYKVGGASKPSPWLCGMGPPDCYGDQRLRPLPNNSECEPKRTNSIALLFLSNQIKSVSFSIWHSI